MTSLTAIVSTLSASFLGSFVEVVEAFTIILAVGISRGWRPAALGTFFALLLLAAMVLLLGPLLGQVPVGLLRFAVGVLLILFGMRWLRKAILRAAGFIALHDEEKAFAAETDQLARQAADSPRRFHRRACRLQGRIARGRGSRLHRGRCGCGPRADRLCQPRRRCCRAGGAGHRACDPPPAVARSGKRPEIRRRPDAHLIRDLLAGRRTGSRLARCGCGNPRHSRTVRRPFRCSACVSCVAMARRAPPGHDPRGSPPSPACSSTMAASPSRLSS